MAPPTLRKVMRGEQRLANQIDNVQKHYAELIERVGKMHLKVTDVKAVTDRGGTRITEAQLVKLNRAFKDATDLWENSARMAEQWNREPSLTVPFPLMERATEDEVHDQLQFVQQYMEEQRRRLLDTKAKSTSKDAAAAAEAAGKAAVKTAEQKTVSQGESTMTSTSETTTPSTTVSTTAVTTTVTTTTTTSTITPATMELSEQEVDPTRSLLDITIDPPAPTKPTINPTTPIDPPVLTLPTIDPTTDPLAMPLPGPSTIFPPTPDNTLIDITTDPIPDPTKDLKDALIEGLQLQKGDSIHSGTQSSTFSDIDISDLIRPEYSPPWHGPLGIDEWGRSITSGYVPYPSGYVPPGFQTGMVLQITAKPFDRFVYKNLPQFSGDHLDWSEWYQLFLVAVGDTDLDQRVKMNFLKTKLDPETRKTIKHYTSKEYENILKLLVEKFTGAANIMLHIEKYAKSLSNMREHPDVDQLAQTVEKLRALSTLFDEYKLEKSFELDIFREFTAKLPKWMSDKYVRTLKGKLPSLKEYLDKLDPLVLTLKTSSLYYPPGKGSDSRDKPQQDRKPFNRNRYVPRHVRVVEAIPDSPSNPQAEPSHAWRPNSRNIGPPKKGNPCWDKGAAPPKRNDDRELPCIKCRDPRHTRMTCPLLRPDERFKLA